MTAGCILLAMFGTYAREREVEKPKTKSDRRRMARESALRLADDLAKDLEPHGFFKEDTPEYQAWAAARKPATQDNAKRR